LGEGCIAVFVVLGALLLSAPVAAHGEGGPAVSWGDNRYGQLGTVYHDYWEEQPVVVEGQANIVAVSGGGNLALLSDGTVSAWGGNAAGQLGDGTRAASWEKGVSHVIVSQLAGVRAVSSSGAHSLALLANHTVKAWGSNQFGQLGNGTGGFEAETHENENLPKQVNNLTEVTAIASGGHTNMALLANHTVKAWGWDEKGQLGVRVPEACRFGVGSGVCPEYECKGEIGWQLCSKVPRFVETVDAKGKRSKLENVVAIDGGYEATYALLKNGHVLAWGANGSGQLGTGAKTKLAEPWVPPSEVIDARTGLPLRGVVAIAAGVNHALALLENGEVVGWGDNEKGELGPKSEAVCGKIPCDMAAKPIPGLTRGGKVTQISAGLKYSLALSGGKVYAIGRDEHGELGNGNTTNSPVPQLVKGVENATSISAGGGHAVAVLAPGTPTPKPLLTLKPGKLSLTISWTFAGVERLECFSFEPKGSEAEPGVTQSECVTLTNRVLQARTVTIKELNEKPLEPHPYMASIATDTKRRVIVATPLP
jgi:alpha-tubulin suppressor-like RCC1 family protein